MKIFITGISTNVGKTITSAIITEALNADYWKPIQAGDISNSDNHKIKQYISNTKTKIHPNSYLLQTPASPHYASSLEKITINLNKIKEPKTNNHLIIEGAGGVLVPLNDNDCIIDLIQPDYNVIIVSRHYLGSINHTLLTIETLKNKKCKIAGIVFSGNENPSTEEIITKKTKIPIIGRINEEPFFDKEIIKKYAKLFKKTIPI